MSASEVEFCDRLREWAESLGFEVYPEVAGWDLVCVASKPINFDRRVWREGDSVRADVAPGEQVGIHAKLRANCDVLTQAVARDVSCRHPTYPFVAAPRAGQGFRFIAHRLGLGVIATDEPGQRSFRGELRGPGDGVPRVREWPRRHENPPLGLPPIASRAIVAGAPSPRVLSPWRVNALRFLAFARGRETFTVTDLKGFDIGKSWVDRWGEGVDWTTEVRRGKSVRVRTYKLTAVAERLPDWGYRDVAAEMAAKETDVSGVASYAPKGATTT